MTAASTLRLRAQRWGLPGRRAVAAPHNVRAASTTSARSRKAVSTNAAHLRRAAGLSCHAPTATLALWRVPARSDASSTGWSDADPAGSQGGEALGEDRSGGMGGLPGWVEGGRDLNYIHADDR